MSPENAITAGQLALLRKQVRELVLLRPSARFFVRLPTGGDQVLYLDARTALAALEAADLNLSDRLLKLGVSEYEHKSLPPPAPEPPTSRGFRGGGGGRGTLRVPKPPKEDA